MHDKRGRLIEEGDAIINKDYNGTKNVVSVVTQLYPGSDTCNVSSRSLAFGGYKDHTSNASETEIVLKHDGTDPVDPPAEKEE